MAKAIHSMIRVLDEKRSVDFYRRAFGLTVAERLEFDGFTLVYLSNDEAAFELELTINKGQTEPYIPGNGYGHLAVCVPDVAAEHARFEAEGLKPRKLVDFKHEGATLARFFFVQDPDGYEIEILQRAGRYR
ncbi:VOC family protein [Leisingera daeponensis]|uniref:VOC family protein n=1 Tax=Leisingera daeponensis TaxID=405746 RepID=UPI001C978A10|nr:VOC family protein [Leisingera daeponensis]MBY6059121.1 VOC family protein [Leisingera daeponensis]